MKSGKINMQTTTLAGNLITAQPQSPVRNELKMFFGQPARIADHLKEADRNLAGKSSLPDSYRREIQKVKDEMACTHKLYIQEQITAQGFGDFYKPAEQRLNQLLAQLPKLEAEVDLMKVNKLSADDVLHEANSLYDRWPSLSSQDKRKIVEAPIEKLVIGDGELHITYSYLPSSEKLCKNQQKLGLG